VEKTWKPVTAGVLSIIAGSLTMAIGVFLVLFGGVVSGILAAAGVPDIAVLVPFPIFGIIAVPLLILGTVAIIGGAYALKRRYWPAPSVPSFRPRLAYWAYLR
jgi:hypothetical protein